MNLVTDLKTVPDFLNVVQSSDQRVVIVDFGAKWCGPCRNIAPLFDELAEKNPNLAFYKVDIDDPNMDEIAKVCQITSLPTFCVFHEVNCIERLNGANPDLLCQLVAKYSNNYTDTDSNPAPNDQA